MAICVQCGKEVRSYCLTTGMTVKCFDCSDAFKYRDKIRQPPKWAFSAILILYVLVWVYLFYV